MLLVDALGPSPIKRFTMAGTLRTPRDRLATSFELVGSIFVASGSAILLFSSKDLSVIVVLLAVAVAGVLVYLVMTLELRGHHKLLHRESGAPRRSVLWCFTHPLWRPPAQDGDQE
jgi:hypothetical protein